MDTKPEVVALPVADVGRAKSVYRGRGWREDADYSGGPDLRVVQLTPTGSAWSIIFGTGLTTAAAGSVQGLNLVVTDLDQARAELSAQWAKISEVIHHAGTANRVLAWLPMYSWLTIETTPLSLHPGDPAQPGG